MEGDAGCVLSRKQWCRSGLLSCNYFGWNGCFDPRRRPGPCNLQGHRAAAAVFGAYRFGRMRLTAHLCTHASNHFHCCGRVDQQEVVRSGRGGSTGARAVHGRFTGGSRAVRVCDGSAGGGKAGQSGERGRGTAVPRHETGRRHLGTVPRHGDPCLASCLAINDRW